MAEPAYLLDLVEATYHAFADHKLHVAVASTCAVGAVGTCGANTDQRGVVRPTYRCDAGAYELE